MFLIKIIFLSIGALCSCSTFKQSMLERKSAINNKLTENKAEELYYRNGNVFYITSTYSSSSTIWTYHDNKLTIFKLVNAKIVKETTQIDNEWRKINLEQSYFREDIENNTNSNVLDGEILCIKLRIGTEHLEESYCIDINRFIEANFNSVFMKKLVQDIKNYVLFNSDI